jgi:hypothetical protein
LVFQHPEGFLPRFGKDLGYAAARVSLDLGVCIHELSAQTLGENPGNSRLPGSHKPGEYYIPHRACSIRW